MSGDQPKQTRRSPISGWGLVEVGGVLLCAATVAGFFARLWWVFELTSHFRLHWAVALAGWAVVWTIRRRWRMASICTGCAVVNAVLVLGVYLPAVLAEPNNGPRLRLISLNVHTENEHHDKVLNFLQSADADVILLMEVNEAWMKELQPLRASYAQVIAEPREDNFGIALFSRLPLTNRAVIELGNAEVPSIATTVSVGGQPVYLLGTHPLPPGSATYARLRNEQLQKIATLIRSQTLPAILLGDLNCTPWSPYFTELLDESGLENTAPQRGLYGSWPAWLPLFRIPLDHVLVSPGIRIIEKHLGPQVGSDHLPLILELQRPRDERAVLRTRHGIETVAGLRLARSATPTGGLSE